MSIRVLAVGLLLSCAVIACGQDQAASQTPIAQGLTGPMQAATGAVLASHEGIVPDATMLRYPDVSRTDIVFSYAGDLWLVSRDGGMARPLASPAGQETFPRFSADGSVIAFAGNYDGNRDLYTISVTGGIPDRVTYHPAAETLCDWTPDGELIFSSYGLAGLGRQSVLATVPPAGGLPVILPVPYGANGAISGDGEWLAYTPHARDARTWKRYCGGMATDIWLFNLKTHASRKITDWEGTDSLPMWHGKDVYYLSDAGPNHRHNIWKWDAAKDKHTQITQFAQWDVKWPSMGPGPDGKGEIVFQNGANLYLLNLATGEDNQIKVYVPGDRPKLKPHLVDEGERLMWSEISSTGKRVVVSARGDIWSLPAEKGARRNLTATDGVAERSPIWSPDGRWIAYFSDASGEYQLYIKQSDGQGETRQLTKEGQTFQFNPVWSPDSKTIAFTDKSGEIVLCTVETGETRVADADEYGDIPRVNWSHDSRWITYTKTGPSRLSAIWLFNVESGEKHQVTSDMFANTWPTFDRKGDYLFFASNRSVESPVYSDIDEAFVYVDTDMLFVVPLRKDVENPWLPKNEEEKWKDEKKDAEKDADAKDDDEKKNDEKSDDSAEEEPADDEDEANDTGENEDESESGDEEKDADKKKDEDGDKSAEKKEKEEPKPLVIDIEGFERRAIPLPVDRGGFYNLSVNDKGQLLYIRAEGGRRGDRSIKLFDLKDDKKKEKTVLDGVGGFSMSGDGKKLLIQTRGKISVVDAAAGQKADKAVDTRGLFVQIDPRTEWRQVLLDAWRFERDFFYDPNMHGVDWPAVRDRYLPMIDHCTSRDDVTFVMGEMIAELNVGHAYVRGAGDGEHEPSLSVGMLGCDYELDDGVYRIKKIIEGAAWDFDARGPLSKHGIDVAEGDYLLAVNGIPLDTTKDPWAAFQGLAGKTITLTVSKNPTMDDEARHVVVDTIGNEGALRYRAWVEHNRAYVEEKSDGKIGYIHVPDTGVNGQDELFRQFFGQKHKDALIVDERWNGGGQIPDRFIELLNRPLLNHWTRQHGKDGNTPGAAHYGPKCMLINGLAGSGGDAFPYYFRKAGLGKLIGTRTWGGLVGISGTPGLVDGGGVTVPQFAFYETDGTWGIEGHGVEPDIEVIADPAKMVNGGDPQLDAAIAEMLKEIKLHPFRPAKRPAHPDRSGMGIPEDER